LEEGYPIKEGAIFSGSASAQVMIVGQAPGTREGGTGLPFSGPAGKRLFSWLARAGFEESEFRATQYITAIAKCFPGKGNSRGDRVPTAVERRLCAPFLACEIEDDRLVLPLPHPSGANLWLNRPASKRLLEEALEHLRRIGSEMKL
jgi:uracil-DNA glycosylase